jgi:AraC family transcriptional regulator
MDFGSFRVRQATYRAGLRQPRHSHEHSNVTIVVAGQLEEASDEGRYTARPCSVVLKGAGCEHEDFVSGYGARTLTIQFAADSPLSALLRPRAWSWLDDPETVRLALAVQTSFELGNAEGLERAAVSLVAAAIDADRADSAAPPAWLPGVRALLDEQFDKPLRFEALAYDLGLHPVYLSRAFHRYCGTSMTEYVRAMRVRHARHVLSSSRRSVAAIAAEAGFADASHLCRTFTQLLGVTPRAYRRATAGKV